MDTENKHKVLDAMGCYLDSCTECLLCGHRTGTINFKGDPDADLMIIGEAPGYHEDKEGKPFVGKSGQILDKALELVGLSNAFITYVVKCKPSENKDPEQQEIHKCLPFLRKQIRIVNPKIIITVGSIAFEAVVGKKAPIEDIHGRMFTAKFSWGNKTVIPTYHPAYILRNPEATTRWLGDITMATAWLMSRGFCDGTNVDNKTRKAVIEDGNER